MIYKVIVNSDIVMSLKKTLHRLALHGASSFDYQSSTESSDLIEIKTSDDAGLNESIVEVLIACGISHDAFTIEQHDDVHADLSCTQYRLESNDNVYDVSLADLSKCSSTEHQYLRLAALAFDVDYIKEFFTAEQGDNEPLYWSFYNWLLDDKPKGKTLPELGELYRFRYNENITRYGSQVESMIDRSISRKGASPSPSN